MTYSFADEKTCPTCHAAFREAEQRKEFHPVVVVTCPKCGALLWLPGSEQTSPLVKFDTGGDDDCI